MLRKCLAALAALMMAAPAQAAPMPVHPYWTVEPTDSGDGCIAALKVDAETTFMVLARKSGVGFGAGFEKPMRPGRQAKLAVDGRDIVFEPDYGAQRDVVFRPGVLSAPDLAGLAATRSLELSVDGELLLRHNMAERGLDEAVAAVQACARGETGFWTPAADDDQGAVETVLHAGGLWSMYPEKGMCVAGAMLENGLMLQLLQQGGLTVGVGDPTDGKLHRGRRGEVRTDQGSFVFTPHYESPSYVVAEHLLTDAQVGLLRSTRTLEISIDGKVIADAAFDDGQGYPEIIDDVAACAAGRTGWWTKAGTP